jgi:hypothetical protein
MGMSGRRHRDRDQARVIKCKLAAALNAIQTRSYSSVTGAPGDEERARRITAATVALLTDPDISTCIKCPDQFVGRVRRKKRRTRE